MRKITKNACDAFLSHNNFNTDNTVVASANNVSCLYLHGNLIATHSKGSISISNAGWATNTTKDRLNGILDLLHISRIYQLKGVWYWLDGQEFPSDRFVNVPEGKG